MMADDFLSLRDFTPAQVRHLIDLAADIKARPADFSSSLKGKTLAMIFEKPSLRTRVSFDVGIHQLGGFSIYLSPAEINLGKRESIPDVARNLERMVQGIMIRTFAHAIVEEMAEYAHVPVINGLTDYSHPCQAMADYLTLQEVKGKLKGLKLAFVGDGNNVAHSLMLTGAALGSHVVAATPAGYEPDKGICAAAAKMAKRTGGSVKVVNDAQAAVAAADAVYTDVWASMGQESEAAERAAIFRPFQVNGDLMSLAAPHAVFMHCLPAHRGDEVTDQVLDSPQSVVFDEAENRMHVQNAIMALTMGGR